MSPRAEHIGRNQPLSNYGAWGAVKTSYRKSSTLFTSSSTLTLWLLNCITKEIFLHVLWYWNGPIYTTHIGDITLHWRHNGRDGVSNHQAQDCLLNHLFRRRSKKTLKLRVTGLYEGNSPVTDEFPHKGPVTRKMFPFDDVIMWLLLTYGARIQDISSLSIVPVILEYPWLKSSVFCSLRRWLYQSSPILIFLTHWTKLI